MFKYSLDNKRYHTINYFYRTKFNSKVFKVPLDAHMSCPNKINGNGCIYCSDFSKSNIINSKESIEEQFLNNIKVLENKWPNSLYIPYFQAGTNTYAPLETLKGLFESLLKFDKVVGLAIATRPDTLSNEVIEYLGELNKKTFLTIELGLQSSNNNTLDFIKRGHDVDCFVNAVKKLKEKGIFVVAHIINGLPYETEEDMLNTIKLLNNLKVDGVKIHMLYISKNTELADIYEKEKFSILSKEEYIDIVIKQLELLDEKIVIERITGDPIKEDLITPDWLIKKFCVLNDIDKEMVKRDTYQGKHSK
ncbi:MAG: TIGR01212 family radical SAM protein [Bacilli bacterium]|nr:TIGR01212 family radical SAM protein [Bacilli bacterium]